MNKKLLYLPVFIIFVLIVLLVITSQTIPSNNQGKDYEVEIVEIGPQSVIGMSQIGHYQDVALMIPQLYEFVLDRQLTMAGAPMFISHEMSAEEAIKADEKGTANLEVVIPVTGTLEDTEKIKFYSLSGGKMAKIIHQGAYADVGLTYEKLFTWLTENEKTLIGFMREVYLNSPNEFPESELITQIYAPIE